MAEPAPQSGLARALRRSWLTILVCVIGGLVAGGLVHVVRKTHYQAVSEVYIAESDLNQLVLGVSLNTDPSRDIANDLQLASSINYAQAVASAYHGGLDYKGVQSHLSVTNDGGDDILKFTATGSTRSNAVRLADVADTTYDAYRASLLSRPIISSLSAGGRVSDVQRLQLLSRLNQNAVVISQARTASPQSRLVRDLAIGLVAGLVVGLLAMALREAVPRLSPDPLGGAVPQAPALTGTAPPRARPENGRERTRAGPLRASPRGSTPGPSEEDADWNQPATPRPLGEIGAPVSTRPSRREANGAGGARGSDQGRTERKR